MNQFILCSQSPRRSQILSDLGLRFDSITPNVNENQKPNEYFIDYLRRVSFEKVSSVQEIDVTKNNSYLSSDTIVVFENEILHKPENEEEAIKILTSLSGKRHQVYSSYYFQYKDNLKLFDFDSTEVIFKKLSLDQIREYILKYKPFDKAGSYGIQDIEGPVKEFTGSYTNVMGFPIRKFFKIMKYWEEYLV